MDTKEEKTKFANIIKPAILIIVLIAAGTFGWIKFKESKHFEKTDNAQIEASTSPIIPRIPGYIKAVYVKDYDEVQAGELLFEIDPTEYDILLQQTEADLQQSRADLENARAGINTVGQNTILAESNIDILEVRKQQAYKDYQRLKNLLAEGAVTQKQFDDAKTGYDAVVQQIESAKKQVNATASNRNSVEAQVRRAEAVIKVKEAQIEQSKLRLTYTNVYAPISGKIGKKSIEAGQYINPGQTVMTIINDSTYWVIGNFKETQLEHIKAGQQVDIKLDAYPKEKITGTVITISDATGAKFSLLPPDNATGNFVKVTQRVPVKIAINDPAKIKDKLRAGLSAELSVKIK